MPAFVPISLQTDRLRLRFLDDPDLPAIFAIYSDPEVMRYWSWPAWTDPRQAEQFLTEVRSGYLAGSALQLGIELRTEQVLVGICVLFQFHPASRRAEIGYALARPYWGCGYMQEALQALLAYAFLEMDLNRLEADIDPRNLASARTLERLGFQKEGYLRERWIVGAEISDTSLYGLLRRYWSARSNLLLSK